MSKPLTRKEAYLAAISGQNVDVPAKPITREEAYLDAILKNGGGGGTSDYSRLTNLPSVNDVTLLGNKTSADLGLQDAIQLETMPTASATYDGKIVQYVGTTTASYTHGYYYECINNGGTYSWTQTNVQPSSGGSGGGHTIENASGISMTQRDALQFTGGLAVSDDSTNNRTIVSVTADQIPYGNSTVGDALDGLTEGTGWVQIGTTGTYYRKVGDVVWVKGQGVISSTWGLIATLPEGYRPSIDIFRCLYADATHLRNIKIDTSGNISMNSDYALNFELSFII